jgi:hypothetical protein
MKLSPVHVFALVAPLAAVVGCSAAAAPTDGAEGSSSSAMLSPIPPIVFEDAITQCANQPADESYTRLGGPGAFAATSNASRACDFSVLEVTGMANQSIMLSLTDLLPDSPYSNPYLAPYSQIDQAHCASSFVDYEVAGWVPPTFHLVGTQVIENPGRWEVITKETVIAGCWGTGSGVSAPHCNLGIEGSGPADSRHLIEGTYPYPTIRVVVKSVAQTAAGPVRGQLYVYKEPY